MSRRLCSAERAAIAFAAVTSSRACRKQKWLDFGVYETLTRAQAASGIGLACNFELLKALLQAHPPGHFCPKVLTPYILQEWRRNETDLRNDLWAKKKAGLIMNMVAHVRRLQKPERLRQCLENVLAPSGRQCSCS